MLSCERRGFSRADIFILLGGWVDTCRPAILCGHRDASESASVQRLAKDRNPDSYKVRSDPIQILTSAPAPAPDMMSPLVLAAAPKAQPTPEILAVEPAARAARAEAPSLTKRVSDRQPPVDPRQNQTVSRGREFGLAGW